jgi:hypothetical protein
MPSRFSIHQTSCVLHAPALGVRGTRLPRSPDRVARPAPRRRLRLRGGHPDEKHRGGASRSFHRASLPAHARASRCGSTTTLSPLRSASARNASPASSSASRWLTNGRRSTRPAATSRMARGRGARRRGRLPAIFAPPRIRGHETSAPPAPPTGSRQSIVPQVWAKSWMVT